MKMFCCFKPNKSLSNECLKKKAYQSKSYYYKTKEPDYKDISKTIQFRCREFDVKHLVRIGVKTDNLIDLQQLKITQILGKGGYGTVFAAIDCSSNNEYAVKVISDVGHEHFEEEVKQELELVKELNHPNIVKVYDAFMTPTTGYLVMEACFNGDLYNYIGEYFPFTEDETKFLSWQMVSAVKYLHDLSVAHRDIKSENFLITDDRLKLCDFGLAGRFEARCSIRVGTKAYSSPQLLQNNYDPFKTDIWALGCTIFELWSLKLPFKGRELRTAARLSMMPRLLFPKVIPKMCANLIKHMIRYNELSRFNIDQVACHKWFKGRESLLSKKVDEFNEENEIISTRL